MTPFVQGLLFLAIAGFMLWLAFADPDFVIEPVIEIIERFAG